MSNHTEADHDSMFNAPPTSHPFPELDAAGVSGIKTLDAIIKKYELLLEVGRILLTVAPDTEYAADIEHFAADLKLLEAKRDRTDSELAALRAMPSATEPLTNDGDDYTNSASHARYARDVYADIRRDPQAAYNGPLGPTDI